MRNVSYMYGAAGARDMIETYGGYVVSKAAPVEETTHFLKAVNLEDLRARSRVAAARVRADYSWDTCVQVVERALLDAVGNRVGTSRSQIPVDQDSITERNAEQID